MSEFHDPLQFVKQFHQILAADKLLVGLFLGAGCPCSIKVPNEEDGRSAPLIADIQGLTKTISERLLAVDDMAGPLRRLCAVLKEDGAAKPNIEVMLSRIRSLRDAAGSREVRGLSAENLRHLDRAICATISETVAKTLPRDGTPYHCLAEFAYSGRIPPLEIFTTNYDLLTEQALESRKVAFFDGFVGSRRPFFDQQSIEDDILPDRWTLLWKLHGSINWRFDRNTKVISRSLDPSDGDELLIHPSHLKYDESRRMPYLVMIDRLKGFLRNGKRPAALFVVGHSFSDDHLNATLLESLRANPSAACYALQFGDLGNYKAAERLAMTEANLNVLARNEAVIQKRRGKWRASPAAESASFANAFEFLSDGGDDCCGVNMERSTNGASEEPRLCRFLLGDFKRFGVFLREVAGKTTRQPASLGS